MEPFKPAALSREERNPFYNVKFFVIFLEKKDRKKTNGIARKFAMKTSTINDKIDARQSV